MIDSPCNRCRMKCSGNNYRRCSRYRDWLHDKLEQMRQNPQPKLTDADAYRRHLRWMGRTWSE